jgi:hypothetical protein
MPSRPIVAATGVACFCVVPTTNVSPKWNLHLPTDIVFSSDLSKLQVFLYFSPGPKNGNRMALLSEW